MSLLEPYSIFYSMDMPGCTRRHVQPGTEGCTQGGVARGGILDPVPVPSLGH